MIYLSGAIARSKIGKRKDIGVMLGYRTVGVTGGRKHFTNLLWAADNGCFTNPDIDIDKYLAWLASLLKYLSTCLFAVAPDVVGDAKATWLRSKPVLPLIRKLGYPAAFVAQDGIDLDSIEWSAFDCLFIGGSTDWKLSAEILPLVRTALLHGKWVHMGRVNSMRRALRARYYGCHSVDGTALKFAPDRRLKEVEQWLDFVNSPPILVGLHGA